MIIMSIYVELINPTKIIYKGEVDTIWLPGIVSPFQVLPNHAPLLSVLDKGTIKIKINDQFKNFDIDGGIVEVKNNKLRVLID
jgi:F-type H+-transporting ATPase subunit epsilon